MRLRSYDARPRAYRLIGKGDYHLGMELEVEGPSAEAYRAGLLLESDRNRVLFAKRDGSLGPYGWELVTHPIAVACWTGQQSCSGLEKVRKIVNGLRELHYTSHDSGNCGLHFHVSASAFRSGIERHRVCGFGRPRHIPGTRLLRRPTHLYWFWRLVNGSLFSQISQRTLFSYCRPCDDPKSYVRYSEQSARHVACNLSTDKNTVEVRIFRGNLRWERVLKGAQAVIAAVEFSRGLSSRNWYDNIDKSYLRYVAIHRATYPELFAYLVEKRLLRQPAQSSQISSSLATVEV